MVFLQQSVVHLRSVDIFLSKMPNTELLSAAMRGCVRDLREQLGRGADVNTKRPEMLDKTALMISAEMGHLECVQILLENGADTIATDNCGDTPLIAAVRKNADGIGKMTISRNFNHTSK